ncbi:hypothetical protein KCTC52924_01576 [Arenibacter antarcticus]|uniref:DUF5689 domain-containing protein n=2 Tax=Arenibacter antarcticus TaxID=2040469 RepID=A0ABW5VIF4_9FLAO|nr:DUF5689 domain-containing protein [Arenibacter sp. H213]
MNAFKPKVQFIVRRCFGIGLLMLCGCVKDMDYTTPKAICSVNLSANASYAEVKSLYVDQTIQIEQDLIIEGYVISSDQSGNFFGVLYFQDRPTNPTQGFELELDVRDTHLFFPVGSKILIALKGLYMGKSKGVFKLGGQFTSFGNIAVGRLPAAVVDRHIFVSCEEAVTMMPTLIEIGDLGEHYTNTLVQLDGVEIREDEVGLPFANVKEETNRNLINCLDQELVLVNSGYADFQAEILPELNGSIRGVLLRENNKYQLAIRSLGDIEFSKDRCADLVDEFSSTKLFISELADPNNNAEARFVELYNSDIQSLSLKGWRLHRYTNANTEISSTIDLSDHSIGAESTFVISPNTSSFEATYGFSPDLEVGTNSPADSNGDDNFQLVDPFGTVIDSFGVVGEDGSATNHEFEDGKAVRNLNIVMANPVYTFSEWTLYNDSGGSGTVNLAQNAPEDFSPGIR